MVESLEALFWQRGGKGRFGGVAAPEPLAVRPRRGSGV